MAHEHDQRRSGLSRRETLQLGGGGALGLVGSALWSPSVPVAEESANRPAPAVPEVATSCEEPLYAHLARRLRRAEGLAVTRQAVLADRAAVLAHVEDLRRRAGRCLGPFPERTPLEPRSFGKLERGSYRVEKLVYASRPGFLVSADLYLPTVAGRRPGVLGLCGHGAAGKAAADNQAFAQGLARRGLAVLLVDPPGQGERLLYPAPGGGSLYGAGAAEHSRAQAQLLALGEHLASWMVWDAIRGLDLLAARPEVDAGRLGVVGHSGGGAIAAWLAAVDRRLSFVACNCFLSSFRRNFENHQSSDAEMLPPGALENGLEQADFLAAAAPAPLLILAQERDFFDVRGAEESHARLAELYRRLGAEDAVELFVGPEGHGFGPENRAALERFAVAAGGGREMLKKEAAAPVEREKRIDLRTTPSGQVAEMGSRPLGSFTAERAARLAAARGTPRGESLRAAVRRVLRLPSPSPSPPEYRILRPRRSGRLWLTTYALEVEPGLEVFVHRASRRRHPARPPRASGPALLALGEAPAGPDALDGTAFFATLRGEASDEEDFLAAHALLLGEALVGRRTFDVLRMVDWLGALGHGEVHLRASGGAVLPAIFAALLDQRVTRLETGHRPPLFAHLAGGEAEGVTLASIVPGILHSFDLDDVYAELDSADVSRPSFKSRSRY